jgi:hypothetical protein
MMCLRVVQEYRGRGIITEGTMYGIQGELVTSSSTRAPQASDLPRNARREMRPARNRQRQLRDLRPGVRRQPEMRRRVLQDVHAELRGRCLRR